MPPLSLLVKPASGLCNMRCKYCFYADVAQRRTVENYGMMDAYTHETMVKLAFQYGDHMVNFAFQGGEPTLTGLDFYKRHVKLCDQYNQKGLTVTNSIQTNGLLIDEAWAKFLADNRFLVGLSLDGFQSLHNAFRVDANGEGTFNRVIAAIKLFNRFGVQYNILCVVNGLVAKNAGAVMDFFQARGVRYIQFIPCLEAFDDDGGHEFSLNPEAYAGFLKTTFDRYYAYYKNGRTVSVRNFDNYIGMLLGKPPESCGMSGICNCYFVVESDGGVFPCDFYVLDRYKLGNIRLQTFEQMRNTETAKNFVRESAYIDPKCRQCEWYQLCRGGCRRNREPFLRGKPSLNRYCEAFRAFFPYSLGRMRELAEDVLRKARERAQPPQGNTR